MGDLFIFFPHVKEPGLKKKGEYLLGQICGFKARNIQRYFCFFGAHKELAFLVIVIFFVFSKFFAPFPFVGGSFSPLERGALYFLPGMLLGRFISFISTHFFEAYGFPKP